VYKLLYLTILRLVGSETALIISTTPIFLSVQPDTEEGSLEWEAMHARKLSVLIAKRTKKFRTLDSRIPKDPTREPGCSLSVIPGSAASTESFAEDTITVVGIFSNGITE